MPKCFTNEYFYEQVGIIHPDIQIDGIYVNSQTKIHCIHICGYQWETSAMSLLLGHGCPKCNHSIKQTQIEFEQMVHEKNPFISIIGNYINTNTKVLVRCNKDNYTWEALPSNLKRGSGCPVCSNNIVVSGINDIATVRPDLIKYFLNIDEANEYSVGSHKHIQAKCPDCGAVRDIEIKSLSTQGFSCFVCNDGISIPNKIACGLLEQLPINNWIREYRPDWSKGRFYDNYFEYKDSKYILEMDGGFHYKDNHMSGQTQKQSKEIDDLKDRLASEHNINVIRIECKESSFDYIINNIKNSVLSKIFDFNCIDWDLCIKYTGTNFIKMICEYFQQNKYKETSSFIADKFHISKSTFVRYKKLGVKIGWCTDSEKERKKSFSELTNNSKSIRVKAFKDNVFIGEFKSLNNCAKQLTELFNIKFYGSSISDAINNNRKYNCIEFHFA